MEHQLHFMVGEKLYSKLAEVSKILKKSIPKTMVLIFDEVDAFLEKYELKTMIVGSKYFLVDNESKKRYRISCHISEKKYLKLRNSNLSFNSYSLAQVIRKLIEFFLSEKLNTEKSLKLIDN